MDKAFTLFSQTLPPRLCGKSCAWQVYLWPLCRQEIAVD